MTTAAFKGLVYDVECTERVLSAVEHLLSADDRITLSDAAVQCSGMVYNNPSVNGGNTDLAHTGITSTMEIVQDVGGVRWTLPGSIVPEFCGMACQEYLNMSPGEKQAERLRRLSTIRAALKKDTTQCKR